MTALTPIRKQLETISEDPAFRNVLREGSWKANYKFVGGRLEEIKGILRERLHVKLGHENMMMPECSVYRGNSSERLGREGLFDKGRVALRRAEYRQAAECFEASAQKVACINQDIANNYRAYALARLGEPLRARMILSPLCKRQFPFSSAYWNLACCMSNEQTTEQLAVLASGLYKAPHPRLLHGAIHLATFLGHKLLAQWLLYLPLTEALLLSHYLDYDRMDSQEKEAGVLRLGAYVFCGEPHVPDPLAYSIPQYETQAFVRAMFERQKHAEVVDFWLRCRSRIGRKRYDYWKMKADYLELFGKRRRAINAFRSELYCRLDLLVGTPELQTNFRFLAATRMRVGIYLRRCMTPELHSQGQAICNMLARFEKRHGICLFPSNPKTHHFFCKDKSIPFAETTEPSDLFEESMDPDGNISPVQLTR